MAEVDLLERLAQMVAPLVAEAMGGPGRYIDAAEVARRYGVDRGWVYAHAEELGALRLGDGPRPRLRFDPARVDAAMTPAGPPSGGVRKRTRGSSRKSAARDPGAVELLPIGTGGGVRSRGRDRSSS
jgi:hypothetical protein